MKLYLVGTPIGNLSDISPRAIDTLKDVDFIAAEDTRVTLKILTHFNIKKPLLSCREHNIRHKSKEIIRRIESGESCAMVSDAGMPCISDPGEELVRECAKCGIEIVVVPGPCALISALCLSGLSTERFSFEGFLSVKKRSRREHLEAIKNLNHTLIFYEAPHKLEYTLKDLYETLGERQIAICRELTKIHEEVKRGNLSEFITFYETQKPRGEFVLVIEGKKHENTPETDIKEAVQIARKLTSEGLSTAEASKLTAKQTGHKRSEIYRQLTVIK
ncbi:MAG: 16S rRNA (cytidine(1402)-2'-O)-methyltransferase [Oscillospiraceae bacterium]|nr:16S rRNA (cytidine(1402)-2'-O)-methyltransferase [Oscillospiraceae bacterium]